MADFKKEFEKNIGKEGMQCFDNDLKFMGAYEICKMVLQDKLTNDMPEMNKYIDGLFNQLKPDITSEVKGNAVTCMSKICTKLNSNQIERIVKELIKQITSTSKEIEDVRDVFVMCIKNIISEVPHDFHDKLAIVISESDIGIKSARQQKQPKAEQELVEIITLMFRRWGNIYKDVKFRELINLLKQNVIGNNVDDNLRKKSCISIGAVSVMLGKDDVEQLVKQLVQEHQNIKNAKEQAEKLKAISQTLNALSKSAAQKMEGQIPTLLKLLQTEYNKWGLQEETEDFDFVAVICELYESYLSTIENLIKGCSHQCFSVQQKQDLIQLSVDFLTFDPNNNCSIEDEEIEMNSDGGSDDSDNDFVDSDIDQDDQSWRVRRGALLMIEQIILTDKHMLDPIYHSIISKKVEAKRNIIKRLREKNEGVRSTIIQVLTSFINQIMVQDHNINPNFDHDEDFGFSEELTLKRVISKLTHFDLQDVIQPIKEEVQKIYNENKSNGQIKIQAFRLIENLALSVGKQILESEVTWKTIFTLLLSVLKDSRAETEIKVSCLVSLKRILKFRESFDLRHIQNDLLIIFQIVQELINSNQFKINAECLRLTSGIFRIIKKCFASQIGLYTPHINKLLPSIIRILEQADVDQEIKHAVISVASGILVHIGTTISGTNLSVIFQNLLHKVNNENKNRVIILKLYKRVPLELAQQLQKDCKQHLNETIKSLCLFLNKEDRSERIATLEALDKLVCIMHANLDSAIQKQIIDGSLHMIKPKDKKDIDPSLAVITLSVYKQLISISPKPCDQYTKILDGCLFLIQSPIFQTNRYDILYEIFSKMAETNIIKVAPTIKTLMEKPQSESINATSRAIAALILVSPEKDKFINEIAVNHALKSHQNDEQVALPQRQVALQTLCEIGKKQNLTSNKTIFEGILNLINNNQEDLDKIRKYASIAFGGISLQNLGVALPQVIDFINQGKNPYLMLNTLKEIIQNSQKINEQQLGSIVNFLFKQAGAKVETKEQDLRNIVSECIGKLCIYNLDFLKPSLLQGLKSPLENVRYASASSFKYFYTSVGKQNSSVNVMEELSRALMAIVGDKSIAAREAVVKSLNSMAFNLPHQIEDDVKTAFFEALKPSFEYFDVIETDLGAFKDKKDKGAPLRTAAFQFLQTCINFKHAHDFYEGIIQVCMGNMAKETEADIKMIRAQILLRLAKIAPNKIIPYVIQVKNAMVDIMKIYVGAKPIPDNAIDLVRHCCEVLHTVDVAMVIKNPDYNNFLEKLKAQDQQKFGKIFESFLHN